MKNLVRFLFLTSTLLISSVAMPVSAEPSLLVIDEFRTRSKSIADDEYIILKNYGSLEIKLIDYSLIKKTSSGRNYTLISKFPDLSLPPNQKLTIGCKSYPSVKDLTYNSNCLADSDNAIILFDNKGKIVDSVTYGEVNFAEQEGESLDNPDAGIPYKRINGKDTDNNYLDFIADVPPVFKDPNANKLIISEMMPNPDKGDEEWFELFNPTNQIVRLDNLKVCDLFGRTKCYKFASGMTIRPRQYLPIGKSVSKITLNDDSDALELRDYDDNVLTGTATFEEAENGISYALFGSTWSWTGTPTKGSQNVLSAIPEEEPKTKKTKKTTKKAAKTTSSATDDEGSESEEDSSEVKGESTEGGVLGGNFVVSKKTVGIFLIVLAFALLLGYTIWDKKDKLNGIYKRLSRRNN